MTDNKNLKPTPEDMAELQQMVSDFLEKKGHNGYDVSVMDISKTAIKSTPRTETFWERHAFMAGTLNLTITLALSIAFWYAIWIHNIAAIVLSVIITFIWRVKRADLLR